MSDEQGKRETLADIVAEIRRAVEYMGDDLPYTVSAGAMRRIASRIEAAWRRERESLMLGPRSWEECIERYKKAREIHDDLY